MRYHLLLCACFVLVIDSAESLRGQPAVPSKATVAKELSAANQRYIDALADYQCVQSSETRAIGAETITFRSTVKCRQVGQLGLMVLTSSTDKPDASRAVGVNSSYSFELRNDPGKTWVLINYRELAGEPHEVFPMLGTNTPICRGLAPYWLDDGVWLADLFAQDGKGARIGSIHAVAVGGHNVLRVEFEYPHKHAPETTLKGHVHVLPDRSWVIAGWVSEMTRKGVTRRTVLEREFHPDDSPIPLPLRQRTTVTSSTSGGSGRETTMTYQWAKEKADPAEFRLTAFGLPEPAGIKWDRPLPAYLWVLLAACGTAVLAIGFRYLSRRKPPPSSTGAQPELAS